MNRAIPGYNYDIVAGADYVLDVSRPVGQRVTRLEVHGRAVAPTDSFTLALTNYRQTGGGEYTMIAGAPVVGQPREDVRQLLIDEVRRAGVLRPQEYFTRNWRIEPAAPSRRCTNRCAAASVRSPPEFRACPRRTRLGSHAALHGRRRDFASSGRTTSTARSSRVSTPRSAAGRGGVSRRGDPRAQAGCAAPQCQLLLVDGGDEFQGTLASNLAFGRPIVGIFNELGYAASALGNHEFDWGQDTLRARMRDARYAILGANVRYADGRDVPWIRDDTLIVRGPLKIGVIGARVHPYREHDAARAT